MFNELQTRRIWESRGAPEKAPNNRSETDRRRRQAAARELTQDAIDTLASVMKDPKAPPAARISAAVALLDRGHGRPTQAVDVAVETYDYSQMTNEQLDELGHLMGMIKVPGGQSLAMLVDDSNGGD
jgi:hypothetical protein